MNLCLVAAILCSALIGGRGESCRSSMNMDVKGAGTATLKRAAEAVIIRNDLRNGPRDTELQRVEDLNSIDLENLQATASYNFYEMIKICHDTRNLHCKLCDVHFIAMQTAKGDPNCYLTCSIEESVAHVNNLPTARTFETYIDIGIEIDRLGTSDHAKKQRIEAGMFYCDKHNGKKKVVPILPLGFLAAKAIFAFGSMVAISFAANAAADSGNDMGTSDMVKVIAPAGKVAAANGGCFMATSHVNVQISNKKIVSKPLKHLRVGDMVESLDVQTGKVTFTPVYYMAHSKENQVSSLLRVFYRDHNNGISSLSLSARHLVYATKSNTSISEPPCSHPIQSKDLKVSDNLWVMNEEKELKPQKIIQIIPFHSEVRHPLTENHHIIVDGVHASVHVLNEPLYRLMTSPLRFLYYINPEWNESGFVEKMVKFVESVKEPIFNEELIKSISGLSMVNTITM